MSMLPEHVRLMMAQQADSPNQRLMDVVYNRPPSALGIEQAKIGLTADDPKIQRQMMAAAAADPGQMSLADMTGITDLHDIVRAGEYIAEHGWDKSMRKGVDIGLDVAFPPGAFRPYRPQTEEFIKDMGVAGKVAAPVVGGLGALGWLMGGRRMPGRRG